MKFHELTGTIWEENKQFFDTCVLPYAALSGSESPGETVARLAALRDLLDWVEIPFKGRTVTYPALQYEIGSGMIEMTYQIVKNLKENHFRHVVVVSLNSELNPQNTGADLVITPVFGSKSEVAVALTECWKNNVSNL